MHDQGSKRADEKASKKRCQQYGAHKQIQKIYRTVHAHKKRKEKASQRHAGKSSDTAERAICCACGIEVPVLLAFRA